MFRRASAAGKTRRPGHARRRRVWVVPVVVVGAAVVAALVTGAVQLSRPLPSPTVSIVDLLRGEGVVGAAPALPWPRFRQAAVAVPQMGLTLTSGPETPVPIASLTKIMTAYVVLLDHPLAPGATGPPVLMTRVDAQEQSLDVVDDATSVPVVPGEILSERQLLDGLLVYSANNFADTLARWDAGSVAAFVAKMNATARMLGMDDTTYVDATGLDPHTQSTAADQLRVASAAMSIPTFAAVVAQRTVTLPLAGTLRNFVPSVGRQGIIGVKSGFIHAAMGCMVLAGDRVVDGQEVQVLAAVLGAPGADPLDAADAGAQHLIDATAPTLQRRTVMTPEREVAVVRVAWTARSAPVVTANGASLLVRAGDVLRTRMVLDHLLRRVPAGTTVGILVIYDRSEQAQVPLRTAASLPPPDLAWRFVHG